MELKIYCETHRAPVTAKLGDLVVTAEQSLGQNPDVLQDGFFLFTPNKITMDLSDTTICDELWNREFTSGTWLGQPCKFSLKRR